MSHVGRYDCSMSVRLLLAAGAATMAAALLLLRISLFRIVDSDFWWHITAGKLMWETRSLIATDPFAFTREGLPYLATHEWLAQILLWATFAGLGPLGIVLLRWLTAAGVGVMLLSLDRRNVWPNAFLVVTAWMLLRQGLMERPQLFTFLIFTAMIVLSLRLLLALREHTDRARRAQRITAAALVALQILWVNLHGAAAVLAFPVVIAVTLQRITERRLRLTTAEWRFFAFLFLGLLLALLFSPNGIGNITYLALLLTDRSASLLQEWNPHPWGQYFAQLGPLVMVAVAALLAVRRDSIALGALLLTFGILSRLGARHEVLFGIVALACTFSALSRAPRWQRWMDILRGRLLIVVPLTAFLILALLRLDAPYAAYLRARNLRGIGTYEPLRGASAFLEENAVTGTAFNTYAAGGYLIYRTRKVFVDGRNVDYGYDFLSRALAAGEDDDAWRALEREHGFTVAIIEHTAKTTSQEFAHLHGNPAWLLVFLDDFASVYVKDIPEHRRVIEQFAYRLLAPQAFSSLVLPEGARGADVALARELVRARTQDPTGIGALLLSAKFLRNTGRLDEAFTFVEEAMRRAPHRYEPYQIAATIEVAKGRWAEAGALLERVIALSRYRNATFDYITLAEIFARAGDINRAEKYRRMAGNAAL